MNVSELWGKRCRSFWKEVVPYIRYVINGGLGVFIILFFTVGGYFYAKWLQQVTPEFPAAIAGTLLLAGFVGWNSIRTFLQEPDKVFLVPLQHQMAEYVKRAAVYSVVLHTIPFTFVFLIYWPVYQRATSAEWSAFVFIWGIIFAMKLVNLRGGWVEQQMQHAESKLLFSIVRWVFTLLLIWLVFAYPVWKAALVILFALLTYLTALRLPRRLPFHWERLIAWEQRHKSRVYMFLSGFADVEQLPQQVRRRAFFEKMSRWIPFRHESAYTYLYFKTWLRSELFSVVWRLTLIGVIIICFLSEWWVKSIALGAIIFLVGMQLAAMRRMHQHAIWIHVYPLPKSSRVASVARLSAVIHFVVLAILMVPLIISTMDVKAAGISLGIGFMLIFIFYSMQKRKKEDELI